MSDRVWKYTPPPYRRDPRSNRIEANIGVPKWADDDGWRTIGMAQDCIASTDLDACEENQEANLNLFQASADLLAVALAYEQWEADLLNHPEPWDQDDTVRIPDDLWQRLLEIQAMRNAAVAKANGGVS